VGPKRLQLKEAIQDTSLRTNLPEATVKYVIEEFIEVVKEAVLDRMNIVIRDFGVLRPRVRDGNFGRVVVLSFKTAIGFRDELKKRLT
jgi:nucleoid DNA-binding protein